jgi:hypothetical protein
MGWRPVQVSRLIHPQARWSAEVDEVLFGCESTACISHLIDNQYAAFIPDGKIGFGVLENPEPAWLEIKELEIG